MNAKEKQEQLERSFPGHRFSVYVVRTPLYLEKVTTIQAKGWANNVLYVPKGKDCKRLLICAGKRLIHSLR